MRILIQVLNGANAGRKILLRPGTIVRFGRTAWADHSFPQDASLGEIHFEVQADANGMLIVRNLDNNLETLVDGTPITECLVRSGQEVQAGQSRFRIFSSDPLAEEMNAGNVQATAKNSVVGTEAAAETELVCQRFELEEPSRPLLDSAPTPDEFLKLLLGKNFLRDAIRFQSFRLSKRDAVWWAAGSVEERLGDAVTARETQALAAARRWVVEPSDEHARNAGSAAESLSYGPAAAWVAAAAFWSGSNIAPPVSEAVAPAEHLTGTAVSSSLLIASVAESPSKIADWLRRFVKRSEDVRLQRDHWSKSS